MSFSNDTPAGPALADAGGFDQWSELQIIGAALACPGIDAARLGEVLALVEPADFCDPVHGRLWTQARALAKAGTTLTPRTLADAMGRDEGFQAWGGFDTLFDLWNGGGLVGMQAHAESIRDRAMRRRIRAEADELVAAVHDPSLAAFDIAARGERALSAMIAAHAPDEASLTDAREAAARAVEAMEAEAADGRPRGLMTGLSCFDHRLGGLHPGWLVVLAGRPSMGKTALARSAAMAAALKHPDRLVVFFALEMDARELSDRTLSELSHLDGEGIAYKDMRGEALDKEDRARLKRLAGAAPANLIIDDSPVLSVDYVRRRLHGLKRRGRLGLVVIDYLQIMQRPHAHGRNEASVIGEMTQGLKQLARELDVCILLLSQLNRQVEGREDKRPQLADLRDSGAIEQDANAVLLCYREAYYLERAEPKDPLRHEAWALECELARRRLEVHAAKIRSGQVGRDIQDYVAEFDHVSDRAPERPARDYREASRG